MLILCDPLVCTGPLTVGEAAPLVPFPPAVVAIPPEPAVLSTSDVGVFGGGSVKPGPVAEKMEEVGSGTPDAKGKIVPALASPNCRSPAVAPGGGIAVVFDGLRTLDQKDQHGIHC